MNEFQDEIAPRLDDETVRLPITFEYAVGRSESSKTRKVLAWIFSLIALIVGLFILFNSRSTSPFILKLLMTLGLYTATFFGVRFLVLQEGKLRKQYYEQLDSDFRLTTEDIWGIYEIEGPVAHFRNGLIGVFVALEKDVIVGLDPSAEFLHYEAIADAYKLAGANRARLMHIDYMANVGKDTRIHDLYAQASKATNPELRAVLNGMYSYLEESTSDEISTFDVYAILVPSTESRYFQIANEVVKEFMGGNYLGYAFLEESQLRDLAIELFNLENFSVVEAQRSALHSTTSTVVVPIQLTTAEGTTRLGKTLAEKRAEAEQERKLQELVKKEKRKRQDDLRQERRRARKGLEPEQDIDEIEIEL